MARLERVPELAGRVMIAAFEGWNDAGSAASGAVEHLTAAWDATEIAAVDPEEYYDFQVNRPSAVLQDDGPVIEWPTTRLLMSQPSSRNREIVLIHGIEPNIRWRAFTAELLDHTKRLKVGAVVVVGALLSDAPHSRPVPVTRSAADSNLRKRLGFEPSRYQGPTGIVGVLYEALATAGLPVISLWGSVPHYVGSAPCPKATLALLRAVEDLLDVPIPVGDLPSRAREWQRRADELVAEDQEVADYVRELEQSADTAELPEASGEYLAREFERYLRRRDTDD